MSDDLKRFIRDRVEELKGRGLTGPLASRATLAEKRAFEAIEELTDVCREILELGRGDIAGELVAGAIVLLILNGTQDERRKVLEMALKVAEDLEKDLKGEK